MSRLVFSLPIELPEDADPVRLGAVFLVCAGRRWNPEVANSERLWRGAISVRVYRGESSERVRPLPVLDVHDRAHLWVDSVPAAVAALVCLARSLRDDKDAADDVRHVAAGVFAALGIDVPTEPGVRK